FRPGLPPMSLSCDRRFRFLSITDLHPRRGTDVLLRAYLEEFNAKEDVALILLVFNSPDAHVSAEAELAFFIERELGLKLENTAGQVTAAAEQELFAGLQCAAPSVEHLRQLLRQVVSDQESTRLRAQQGRRDAVSLWDWDVVLREWISAFRHLVQSEQHLQRWTGESI